MEKDPNKQNPTPDKTGDNSKQVTVSSDDWKQMQSNMKHMSNTVNNLSTKLENAHKASHDPKPKPAHHDPSPADNGDNNSQKYVSRDEFNKLTDQYKNLTNRFKQQNTRSNVLKHAKDTLKQNGMHVSATTFNHLLGNDARSTDENINWFKPVYKKLHANHVRLPRQTKHNPNKPNFGTELAKTDANNAKHMNSLDMYLK